jgi:uncharacterized protein YbaR (Trm112 family)
MDKHLLDILVDPVTKGPLIYDSKRQELISRAARLAYPIRDGIPVMLPEEAREVTRDVVDALSETWLVARQIARQNW